MRLPGYAKPTGAHNAPNYVAPNGSQITGTAETVLCTARVNGIEPNGKGGFDPSYAGDTDVSWDTQETVVREGQRIFVDETGSEWPENKLVVRYFHEKDVA